MNLSHWLWRPDVVIVRINRVQYRLSRADSYECKVPEALVSKTRDKQAALTFLRKLPDRQGRSQDSEQEV
jgi:putative transposase